MSGSDKRQRNRIKGTNVPKAGSRRLPMVMLREIKQILTAKEKKQAVVITGFDLLMAILDIGFLAVLMLLVSKYTEGSRPVALTGFSAWLSRMPAILFLLLFLLKNAAAYASGAYTHRFFAAVSTRLSMVQLKNYFHGGSGNFNYTDASVFVRRISQQPVEFSTYILANIQTVVSQTLLAICAIGAILLYHPALFVVLFTLLSPPLLWMGWLLRKRLRRVRQETKRIAEKAIQFLQESLGGYVEANVYRKAGFFVRRFVSQQGEMNDNIARQQTLQTLPSRLLETVAVAGFFLLVGFRKWFGGAQETDWLTVGVFLGAAWKIIPALVRVLNSSGQIKTYSFILPDLVGGSAGVFAAGNGMTPFGDTALSAIRSVSVQQLQYCHAPGKPELKITFHLDKGDLVALSGRSGSGKTTLLQLLAGFLHPGKGAVKINLTGAESGAKPAEVTGIAYVKQQPFLLNDTLRKNISLSDADNDQEKIARIVHSVGLGPLLSANRLGLEQPVTENGRNISGGQRQRIMLARALYNDPQLLLLDEPFSELDEPAEREMMQLLLSLAASGMIIFIATHNAAAARLCHSVISLDEAVYA